MKKNNHKVIKEFDVCFMYESDCHDNCMELITNIHESAVLFVANNPVKLSCGIPYKMY